MDLWNVAFKASPLFLETHQIHLRASMKTKLDVISNKER